MHPVGPEPPTVYWLRRAGIVVVALVVLVSLFWLIGGRGSADDAAAPAPSTAPTAGASGEPTTSASGEAQPSGAPVDCPDTAIRVTAATDAKTYAVGSQPQFSMTIENIGDASCLRDVGPKANSLEVTSGGFHVWSSDDCNPSDKSKVVVLEPGEKVATSIAWSGQQSQKGCPTDQPNAKAGSYDLTGTNGTVTSEKARFRLTKN